MSSTRSKIWQFCRLLPDVFGKVWAELGARIAPASNYSFRRTAANAGLALTLSLPRPKAQAEVVWSLYPNHADFAATLTASGSEDISLVEVTLPNDVSLAQVRGPALHHWNRQKTAVQIWLQQPLAVVWARGLDTISPKSGNLHAWAFLGTFAADPPCPLDSRFQSGVLQARAWLPKPTGRGMSSKGSAKHLHRGEPTV